MTDATHGFVATSSKDGLNARKGLNPQEQREQGTLLSAGTHVLEAPRRKDGGH